MIVVYDERHYAAGGCAEYRIKTTMLSVVAGGYAVYNFCLV